MIKSGCVAVKSNITNKINIGNGWYISVKPFCIKVYSTKSKKKFIKEIDTVNNCIAVVYTIDTTTGNVIDVSYNKLWRSCA